MNDGRVFGSWLGTIVGTPRSIYFRQFYTLLGVAQYRTDIDFDTQVDPITCTFGSGGSHLPFYNGLLIVRSGLIDSTLMVTQTVVSLVTGEVKTRTQGFQASASSKVFTATWNKMYDTSLLTNSTDLSALASALGVPEMASLIGIQTSVEALGFGMFITNSASLISDLPSDFGDDRVMIIKAPYGSSYGVTAIDIEGNKGVYTKTAGDSWNKQ